MPTTLAALLIEPFDAIASNIDITGSGFPPLLASLSSKTADGIDSSIFFNLSSLERVIHN
jgi:hypothetical protein